MTKTNAIELRNLKKTYMKDGVAIRAVDDVSITIQPGEFLAIVGASGSGKSTLLNILGLLDRPDAGEHLMNGAPVAGLDDAARARLRNQTIGFVFQAYHLLPRTTAVENVFLPLLYAKRGDYKRRSEEAIAEVGLADRTNHFVEELSGGQQQRVAIARAIVNRPAILLADEPTGNLDAETAAQIIGLLQRYHRAGMTLVLVTHDAALAAMADRVIHISEGTIASETCSRSAA